MNSSIVKISIKIGLVTAAIIILFQVTGLFFIYKYFKFDYYLSAVALVFLTAGFIISKYNSPGKIKNEAGLDPFLSLTIKEQQILQLIIAGKSNKEIAATNYVEVSTIKTHINNIYAKLGLNSRKEAVIRYKTRFNIVETQNIHPLST